MPTSACVAQAICFNKPQCNPYFENLAKLLHTNKFTPYANYNMDETGISMVSNKPPKVILIKPKHCANKIYSAEHGINVTLANTVNFIPLAIIFPRQCMKAELLDGAWPFSMRIDPDMNFINTCMI